MTLCTECGADCRYCGHDQRPSVWHTVRFEGREHGSLGAFRAVCYEVEAQDCHQAIELARKALSARYELRFGGDWRFTDGGRIWMRADATEAPMLLPCQTEGLS